ncbi:hypothetical protein BDN71DRAFT_1453297 [Pleurotus eryngii]|uniref:Uncharacterized protein n=1 Tax=Pleurotus eryngii TaxID=5323 RepID=A0A9P5ZRC3_PLEER|nr:hypothetical protein BDN71DRAFT_1453297 [Pleurotus eryngii]
MRHAGLLHHMYQQALFRIAKRKCTKRPTNLTCFPPRNGCSTPYGSPWHEYLV